MPQLTATATRALWKLNIRRMDPGASERAKSRTSETTLDAFALSTTSTIPTTMINAMTPTTKCTTRTSRPAPLANPRRRMRRAYAGRLPKRVLQAWL
jgi:hypothetical protein